MPLLSDDLEVLENGIQIIIDSLFIFIINGNLSPVGFHFLFEDIVVVFGFWLFLSWLFFKFFKSFEWYVYDTCKWLFSYVLPILV